MRTGQMQSMENWNKNNSGGCGEKKVGKEQDRILCSVCKNLARNAE